MQRPSLGSPAGIHSHGHRRRDESRPVAYSNHGKPEKPAALRQPERAVHLIPVVVLLCFLVLLLVSHDPSPADLLAVVRGSGWAISAEKGEVVAIGGHRSLHHVSMLSSRPRKLGKSCRSALLETFSFTTNLPLLLRRAALGKC